jgi:TetR/AcrR family transcriptional repressor of nem operon
MKKSKIETVETHENIVKSASEQFRSKGIAATGISEIMSTVGLTNGGFYRHFDSKDQLITEALQLSTNNLIVELEKVLHRGGKVAEAELLAKHYLSRGHRDNVESGCPLAGIGSELSRVDITSQQITTDCINRFIDIIKNQTNGSSAEESKSIATATVCMLVGALTLSRTVTDKKLSNDILLSAIQAVTKLNA